MTDFHAQMLLDEYREALPVLESLKAEMLDRLHKAIEQSHLYVTAIESRVKTEKSLAGKLALKGSKYDTLSDITDLVGARVITFYTDDVDRVAAMAEQNFEIDWDNSVDKRKLHQLDSFGYNSLHYVCRLPGYDFRFELQLRTTLQHAWAAINHDTGYKNDVEIPKEYMRRMNRLAGLLEMADDEFSRIRTELNDYRRRVQTLVRNGKLDDVLLDGDTFRSFLQARPFDTLNRRIAAINQAEIQEVDIMGYLSVFRAMGCNTLGDISRIIQRYSDDAYALARHQLGNTDLDIIASSLGIQNICIVYILSQGGGKIGLVRLFNAINGVNPFNEQLADMTYAQASTLRFMQIEK